MAETPSTLPPDHDDRLRRARLSLEGLSVGDAFGEQFFGSEKRALTRVAEREVPPPPWDFTDDTMMAVGIFEVLSEHGRIHQDELAGIFARRYAQDPSRKYGGTARRILEEIGTGRPWRFASSVAFGGAGSMGNGGAMRVAPLGAYFADDYVRAAREARASAEITHANAEGQAGAIAVAVAVAWAWRAQTGSEERNADALFDAVLNHTPGGDTREGILRGRSLDLSYAVETAVNALGNGSRITAPDTVPFVIWCAARHPASYEDALWTTVSGLGDRDTTCAMVGGIVALSAGPDSIPPSWIRSREPLPEGME